MSWDKILNKIKYDRHTQVAASAAGLCLLVLLVNFFIGLAELSSENQKLKNNYKVVVNQLAKLEKNINVANNIGKDIWQLSQTTNPQISQNGSPLDSYKAPQVKSTAIGHTEYLAENTNFLIDMLTKISSQLNDKEGVLRRIPSQLPVMGLVSSRFGYRMSPFTRKRTSHRGLDVAAKRGTPVYAAAQGVIKFSGFIQSYGNYVDIDHGNGIMTRYAHNSKLVVERGDFVKQGQLIAKVGSTGRSTGPHLHFEVWLRNTAVNPEQFLFEKPEFSKQLLLTEGFHNFPKKTSDQDDENIISIGGEFDEGSY